MLQLACHNPEIDWKTEKLKIIKCPNKCGKQWKTEQTKRDKKKEERVQNTNS